MIIQYVRT